MAIDKGRRYWHSEYKQYCIVTDVSSQLVTLRFDDGHTLPTTLTRAQTSLIPEVTDRSVTPTTGGAGLGRPRIGGEAQPRPAIYSGHRLFEWQELLEERFRLLKETKSKLGGAPIYALEHGISSSVASRNSRPNTAE